MRDTTHLLLRRTRVAIVAGVVLLAGAAASAQTGPAIPGVTGAAAPEGGDGGTAVVQAVAEGTRRLLRLVGVDGKDGNSTSGDPLKTLTPGMTVVLRSGDAAATASASAPSDAPTTTEARVLEVDRRRGIVLLRLADKTTSRLQLPDAKNGGGEPVGGGDDATAGEAVSVSYIDGKGDRVQIAFRRLW